MRVLYVSPSELPSEGLLGAYLKNSFDRAIREGYDAIVYWRNPRQDSQKLAEGLTDALVDNPQAAAVFAVSRYARGRRNWIIQRWSYLMSFLSGHPQRTWWALGIGYRTEVLSRIAYELNTYEAHFEAEVLLQLLAQRAHLLEIYGPHDDRRLPVRPSFRKMSQSLKSAIKYRLQTVNLFYDFRFHPEQVLGSVPQAASAPYRHKFAADSPHQFIFRDSALIPSGSRVLDIGCASGYLARRLAQERQCQVVGVDCLPREAVEADNFEYHAIDIEKEPERLMALVREQSFDVILMLDVLEHLSVPETFLLQLYRSMGNRRTTLIVSTGNVAYFVVRLMLLLGYFNYGNKGILDITHKRLFSVRTFRNLLDQTGFIIQRKIFFPLPFQELGLSARLCRWFERVNRWLLKLRPSLYAYQVLFVAHSTKRIQPPVPEAPSGTFVETTPLESSSAR